MKIDETTETKAIASSVEPRTPSPGDEEKMKTGTLQGQPRKTQFHLFTIAPAHIANAFGFDPFPQQRISNEEPRQSSSMTTSPAAPKSVVHIGPDGMWRLNPIPSTQVTDAATNSQQSFNSNKRWLHPPSAGLYADPRIPSPSSSTSFLRPPNELEHACQPFDTSRCHDIVIKHSCVSISSSSNDRPNGGSGKLQVEGSGVDYYPGGEYFGLLHPKMPGELR
ncbi:MAG: hypothetical protein L6R41_007393 [Letrouitia leprolyta]|nr:MAG: hypothetical protein L6R41_007393 [Letrouitia leprolyta]